jgi:thiol-disulfide isomerase/thioredoxin
MSRKSKKKSEERVVTISWQPVAFVVLLVAVVAGGFWFGKHVASGGDQASTVAAEGQAVDPASDPASVPANAGQAAGQVVQVSPGQQGTVIDLGGGGTQPQQKPVNQRYRDDIVYDLPQRPHPLRGKPAPDFTMTRLDTGEQVKLSDYAGQPVLVDFWATWCPPCRLEMPWLEAISEKYADDGLVVLGFNVGEKVPESMAEQTIRDFVDEYGLTFPILVDEQNFEVQRDWTVTGYPAAFFIDREGTIVDFHQGMFPNRLTLETRLQETILPEATPGEDL